MIIAQLIREFLSGRHGGATTSEVASYCIMQAARFNTENINKSVSGQLSKMRDRGEVRFKRFGKGYVWLLK